MARRGCNGHGRFVSLRVARSPLGWVVAVMGVSMGKLDRHAGDYDPFNDGPCEPPKGSARLGLLAILASWGVVLAIGALVFFR